MNIEDIKVGETYYVRVKVAEKYHDKIITRVVSDNGSPLVDAYTIFLGTEALAFALVNPYPAPIEVSQITEIPEPAPKYYAPCRKFKKRDKVSPCFWYDRPPVAYYISDVSGHFTPEDGVYEVDEDELPDSTVLVKYKGKTISMQACHLELMTPVEELEPFLVCQDAEMECFEVYKNEYTEDVEGDVKVWHIVRTTYFYGDNQGLRTLAEAKVAAEAERDRLNEEWRKEQE